MRWIVVALALGMQLPAGIVKAQGNERESNRFERGERFDRGARPQRGGRPDWGQMRPPPVEEREATVAAGYVFFDGHYVAPPYRLQREGEGLSLNGRALGFRNVSVGGLADNLRFGEVIVAFDDEPANHLRGRHATALLRMMGEADPERRAIAEFFDDPPPNIDRARWQAWLSTYVAPAEVRDQAAEKARQVDEVLRQSEASIAANQRLSTLAYPLTIFGMLMSVIAFGYLLQFPPRGNSDLVPSRRRAELCRATVIFLAMVVVLSGLDLAWTLLASQAGQMHELNPIGKHLLDEPWTLALFKGGATLASCGLLLALRRHPRAQLASWWMCLVCTLLTFRWLVLNSMFVA